MSINNVTPAATQASQQPTHTAAAAEQSEKTDPSQNMTTQQQTKAEFNRSILQATLEVNINAGNDSLALVFKAATEKINEILEPDLGPRALDNAVESGLDVSPEATADRIVSLTTGLFSRFQEANPELQGSELVDHFTDVIGGGILQGFGEAREILDGMGALTGDIAGNIDQTYDLVVEKLEQFRVDNGGSERSDNPGADTNIAE